MLSKIMMGGLAAALLALVIVFNLLLSAREANGTLQQGIEDAKGINERQALAMAAVQKNRDQLVVQINNERRRTRAATEALEASREGLVAAKVDFDQRIKLALEDITDEELVCASEFVPAGLIDSLYGSASSID